MEVKDIDKLLMSMGVMEYQIDTVDYDQTILLKMHIEEFKNLLSILSLVYLKDKYPALQNEWGRYVTLCKIAEQ